jgi:hypothetical protein
MLASVDKRSYSRALLRDADAILEKVVFPMSFPWTHPPETQSRITPRDIDEMPGVRAAGAVDRFKGATGKRSVSGERIVTRRSTDPGVIEYTTSSPSTLSRKALELPLKRDDYEDEDINIPGELSLRMFHEVQARKRQRIELELVGKETKLISVRIGSTSSRSKIFEAQDPGKLPLIIPAHLPHHVQDGRKMSFSVAKDLLEELGDYNCRISSGMPAPAGKNRNRVWGGRTRLMWTEKDQLDLVQRSSFRSLLTGQKLDYGSHKRPTKVQLAIRLNGHLLAGDADIVNKCMAESATNSQREDQIPSYGRKIVNEAIEAAYIVVPKVPSKGSTPQCTLNREALLLNVLKNRTPEEIGLNLNLVGKIRKPLRVHSFLFVTPPKIECLPAEDGLIRVLCSVPGSFDDNNSNVAAAVVDDSSKTLRCCSVCWSDSAPGEVLQNPLLECHECGILVHKACYGGRASKQKEWKCDACIHFQSSRTGACDTYQYRRNRRGIKCEMCPRTGGSICRRVSGKWVHDVCRIWCDSKIAPAINHVCALCSESSSSIVICAAKGCHVAFHPVCGIIASLAAVADRNANTIEKSHSLEESDKAAEKDAFLCTQYRLAMIDTSWTEVTGPTSLACSRTLPVGFCGYHNPDRQADFAGLYPGNCYLGGAMRIPPLRAGK